jgi:hypothetical protein
MEMTGDPAVAAAAARRVQQAGVSNGMSAQTTTAAQTAAVNTVTNITNTGNLDAAAASVVENANTRQVRGTLVALTASSFTPKAIEIAVITDIALTITCFPSHISSAILTASTSVSRRSDFHFLAVSTAFFTFFSLIS